MSLSGSLFNGVSGLQTAQRQINVTSGNVSNANVDGYSKKTAAAVTRLVDGQNSGVEAGPIRREVDAYLDSEAMRARTELGALDTRSEYLNRVSDMFGTLSNDSTLANGLNALSSALEALSVEPESASVRRDVVEAADAVARQLNNASDQTIGLRVEASNEIDQGVATVNGALERVSELNDEISRGNALDRPTADLEDERDRQLETLSEWMDISTFSRENGAIAVMGKMANGSTKMLVDSGAVQFNFTKANALQSTATPSDGVPTLASAGTPADSSEQLGAKTGGKLGALIDVRDNTLTDFHRDLDRLTQTVRDRVNAAHNKGTVGNALQASITGTRAFTASGSTVIDPAQVSGEMYLVTTDGTTETRNPINLDTFSGSPDTVDELVNHMNGQVTGTPFDASSGKLTIDPPPGQTAVGLDVGNAQVGGALNRTVTAPPSPTNFSHYFGLNDLFVTNDDPASPTEILGIAGEMYLRSDIKADPAQLSTGRASDANGSMGVAVGDATVAQAMADAFENRGRILKSDGNLGAVDTTMSGYAADILSFQASETSRTETARDFQQTMYDELKFRSDSKSGVNVDEELSNMLVFEQAYNASARVISTVQQMFDTLDRMMN